MVLFDLLDGVVNAGFVWIVSVLGSFGVVGLCYEFCRDCLSMCFIVDELVVSSELRVR